MTPSKKAGMNPIPVTVLSGFLGAGKTTVLNYLLNHRHGKKLAIIVNDMSEVNIDAELVQKDEMGFARTEEKIIEMSNGCICCTLREDLLKEVGRLAHEKRFDGIVIESTGISEPLPVAETFTFEDESGFVLNAVARLDTLVTVVDAKQFLSLVKSGETLNDRHIGMSTDDERGVSQLLTDQVEFANIILLSKCDVASPRKIQQTKAFISLINPDALVYEIKNGIVPLEKVFDTRLFDMEKVASNPAWLREPRGAHLPETENYGIESFVFTANRPFQAKKLLALIESGLLKNVLRSKGFVWTDEVLTDVLLWSQSGKLMNLEPYGKWRKRKGKILGEQRIVFIGIALDQELIRTELERVLTPIL